MNKASVRLFHCFAVLLVATTLHANGGTALSARNSLRANAGARSAGASSVGSSSNTAARIFDSADYATIADAVRAATLVGGGEVRVRPGTHVMSNLAISSDTWLVGVRGLSILQCVGGGDGIVISQTYAHDIRIENLVIEADSAACGKAINFSNATYGAGPVTIRDVDVASGGAGAMWAYGFWATFLERANIESLSIFQSAAVGMHLENASNQVRMTGVDITGASNADAAFARGMELMSSGPELFGGTVQGYFARSAIDIQGPMTVQPSFFATDVENSNASPEDGADIVIDAASNVSFFGVTGVPSVTVEGIVRGCNLNGGNLGAVTFGAEVIGCMVSSARAASIVDNNGMNGWVNIQTTDGGQELDKVPWKK